MTFSDIGALRRADEGLNHQIADTFATVAESDRAWTEKIWTSIARADGSLQVDFGLGKYHNRGIIDGFGGVSRGREQWTVRASRELDRTMRGLEHRGLDVEVRRRSLREQAPPFLRICAVEPDDDR